MPHSVTACTRRELLQFLALGSGCLAAGAFALPAAWAAPIYYTDPARGFEREFAGMARAVRRTLAPRLGEDKAGRMELAALASFRTQLPRLPDVGGERNPDTRFLVVAAWYAALWEGGNPQGLTPEDVGRLVYDLNRSDLEQGDSRAALAEGAARFTPQAMQEGTRWAAWTRRREYPDNWVADFLVGDGRNFDFGYDYAECGVVKYLRGKGLPFLAPYVCLNDFLSSRTQGTGLRRGVTLALGFDRCDFRYKKGRPVTQDWRTEAPIVAARSRELGWI